jgi:NAD(P)-dependent dehydrogenase (short-subunit alcohol dehydrogenase family)
VDVEVDLAGRVALVTGPGGALAQTIQARLLASGAKVEVSADRPADRSAVTVDRHGRLDILVNLSLPPAAAVATDVAALCRHAAEIMSAPGGRILNIVSALGVIPARGEAAASAEAAAILSLTRVFALECGPRGILVNALAVGAMEEDDPLATRLITHVPLARSATLGEIADAALFLLDPENSYTTGHVLVVDGGWTAGYARNF